MTAATWLLGWAAGLLLVGLAGIVSAIFGHRPDWSDLYIYLPILITGTAIGWLSGAALEFQIHRDKQRVNTRLDEARAWASELQSQERELAIRAVLSPAPVITDAEAERAEKSSKLDTIFRAGTAAGGFSHTDLDGCVGSTTLTNLHEFYTSDAGLRLWRIEPGNVGTRWGYGWGLDLALRELALGRIPLPPFQIGEVRPYVRPSTIQNTGRKGKAKVIIDAEAVKA